MTIGIRWASGCKVRSNPPSSIFGRTNKPGSRGKVLIPYELRVKRGADAKMYLDVYSKLGAVLPVGWWRADR